MIIVLGNDDRNRAAANILAKKDEIIVIDRGVSFQLPNSINDVTLTLVELSGDRHFQGCYDEADGKGLAEWLWEIVMPKTVRHIEIIASDVKYETCPLSSLSQSLRDYLYVNDHYVEVHAPYSHNYRGTCLLPKPESNSWEFYGIPIMLYYNTFPPKYKPTTDDLLFRYRDKLEKTEIQDLRKWIRDPLRTTQEYHVDRIHPT